MVSTPTSEHNWQAKTKTDLMIEVWEKLDCESVGAVAIESIEAVVRDVYGPQAVEMPMSIARTLADEGAYLRHHEVMDLHIARAMKRPYDAAFRNVMNIADLASALRSLRSLEALRKKFIAAGDKDGLRLVRESAIRGKEIAEESASREQLDRETREVNEEISRWFSIWMQTPELFDQWIRMRMASPEYRERFAADS